MNCFGEMCNSRWVNSHYKSRLLKQSQSPIARTVSFQKNGAYRSRIVTISRFKSLYFVVVAKSPNSILENAVRRLVILVFQLWSEGLLLLGEELLLEMQFGLALDCESVAGDLEAELANGVGRIYFPIQKWRNILLSISCGGISPVSSPSRWIMRRRWKDNRSEESPTSSASKSSVASVRAAESASK